MWIHWSGDGTPADESLIQRNLDGLLRALIADAQRRVLPSVEMARTWHRRMLVGVSVPIPYFRGGIRDSNPAEPELIDYPVGIIGPTGVVAAVPAANVWSELAKFEVDFRQRLSLTDEAHPDLAHAISTGTVENVLELCGWVHGEWVRIHPFVNGNGRVARLLANWVALRYGLPAFVRLRPRPAGATYASAAERSMRGDHRYTVLEMGRMFDAHIVRGH